jgi:hypothetical protein
MKQEEVHQDGPIMYHSPVVASNLSGKASDATKSKRPGCVCGVTWFCWVVPHLQRELPWRKEGVEELGAHAESGGRDPARRSSSSGGRLV